MKQSIGYTVSLNIVIVFIVIIFAFMGGAISYYKAFKVNNVIADSIVKYEGYNELSKAEISQRLTSLGYNQSIVNCGKHGVKGADNTSVDALDKQGNGYCVFYSVSECLEGTEKESIANTNYCKPKSYNYVIRTYLRFNLPIVNTWLKFPVYTKTKDIYACYGDNC